MLSVLPQGGTGAWACRHLRADASRTDRWGAMDERQRRDVWASGAAYEPYVGRWSRLVARELMTWLGLPAGGRWLDLGCGTGALTQTILAHAAPALVLAVDRSESYVAYARERTPDGRARFSVADGLALMRRFWDAAVALDPAARELDEGRRFPLCRPEPLRELFAGAGLAEVEARPIDVPTVFADFDDYWSPFLGGQGPAPGYATSLGEAERARLRDRLRTTLPTASGGSIHLVARAWAVRGRTAGQ